MALVTKHNNTPGDVSTKILSSISEVSKKDLTARLAAEWVSTLEADIQQTKSRIHERIHSNYPHFEQQLETSKLIQTRLADLTNNVDRLTDTLNNPTSGLLPTLLKGLKDHSELAQRTANTRHAYDALTYASRCCSEFEHLKQLVDEGKLIEGVSEVERIQELLEDAPLALQKAQVMTDMKTRIRVLKDTIEEQLIDAYTRSVRISSTEFHVSPSIEVRQTKTIISLSDIFSCLSDTSRESHLSSLRRDLVAFFIDFPLQQCVSAEVSRSTSVDGAPSHILSLFPLPPTPGYPKQCLQYLRTLFDFLSTVLLCTLPPSERLSLSKALYIAASSAVLRDVLTPSIPSSLDGLSSFASLLHDAVQFEQDYRSKMLEGSPLQGQGDIEAWADSAAGHYGRKRRVEILENARALVVADRKGNKEEDLRVEMRVPPSNKSPNHVDTIAVQGDINEDDPDNGDSWDFDDAEPVSEVEANGNDHNTTANGNGAAHSDDKKDSETSSGDDEPDGWDFEEESSNPPDVNVEVTEEDADAWGWGDDPSNDKTPVAEDQVNVQATNGTGSASSNDSAWDDVWDEPAPEPIPQVPQKPVKAAKGLEKLTKKTQKIVASPTLSVHSPQTSFPLSPAIPSSASSVSSNMLASPRPDSIYSQASQNWSQTQSPPEKQRTKPDLQPVSQKPPEPEFYTVSGRAQALIRLVTDAIEESQETLDSDDLAKLARSNSTLSSTSTLLLQSAYSALDLYCAIFPVSFAPDLQQPSRAFRFANDCTFIKDELLEYTKSHDDADRIQDTIHESLDRLDNFAGHWFDSGVDSQRAIVLEILARAEGFVDTGDQDRFDECESVMSEVLRSVRMASNQWKAVLPRTRYFTAVGLVVEAALKRVLADVLALPDIPEVDSRRLSELGRILNALEGLFVDTDGAATGSEADSPSMVVAFVPSWLKYSYLSELLEASIADIAYLFEEGALIDFEVRELIGLVKALFADTPLRTNTIAKLQRGHPVSV